MMGVGVDQAGNDFLSLAHRCTWSAVSGKHRRLPKRDNLAVIHRDIGVDKPPGVQTSPFLTSKSNFAMNLNSPFADCAKIFYMIGAERRALGTYSLVGCSMSPGFEFSGFELAPEGWQPD